MTKLRKERRLDKRFGGLFYLSQHLQRTKIPEFFDKWLPSRVPQAKYTFTDLILNLYFNVLVGSTRLTHGQYNYDEIETYLGKKPPSPESVSAVLRDHLTVPSDFKKGSKSSHIHHEINHNAPLNDLLIRTAVKTGVINPRFDHTLDMDATIIPANKRDAEYTYEKSGKDVIRGYQPMVAIIDRMPVYVIGRNGNCPASAFMIDHTELVLKALNRNGINVTKFRADSAAYNRNFMHFLHEKGINFYIRAKHIGKYFQQIHDLDLWSRKGLKQGSLTQYAEIDIPIPKRGDEGRVELYRLVCFTARSNSRKHGKVRYSDYAIITNDWDMPILNVIEFYNRRGAEELLFRDLKNHFNWSSVPHSYLKENTTYLILTSICYVLYSMQRNVLSGRVHGVKKWTGLGKFRRKIIEIPGSLFESGLFIPSHRHTHAKIISVLKRFLGNPGNPLKFDF